MKKYKQLFDIKSGSMLKNKLMGSNFWVKRRKEKPKMAESLRGPSSSVFNMSLLSVEN